MGLTKQAILDGVWDWFIVTGSPAGFEMDRGTCVYRSEDGKLRCGVGCLIPDDLYRPEMEGASVGDLMDEPMETELAAYLGVENVSLLSKVQLLHDDLAVTGEGFASDFRKGLLALAEKEGVRISHASPEEAS
jgi:hypothetical protein